MRHASHVTRHTTSSLVTQPAAAAFPRQMTRDGPPLTRHMSMLKSQQPEASKPTPKPQIPTTTPIP